jgi:Arylsulfotransferase (ASST)
MDANNDTRLPPQRSPRRRHGLIRPVAVALMTFVVVLATGAVGSAPLPPWPDDPEGVPPALTLTSETLYPSFDRRRHHYVLRCADKPVSFSVQAGRQTLVAVGPRKPRAGHFRTTSQIQPGQDLVVEATREDRRETYSLRCLPAGFPEWDYQRLGRMRPGLFTVTLPSSEKQSRAWVIVFDSLGTPRWWYSPKGSALGAQLLPDGTITWSRSFGDGYGVHPRMAHEVRSLSGDLLRLVRTRGSITDSHEFEQLPNGNILLATFAPQRGIDLRDYGNRRWHLSRRASVVFPEVQEIDSAGRVAWRWNSRDRIDLDETPARWWDSVRRNPHPGPGGAPTYDPFHINSIDPWGRRQLVVSMRHTDGIYGIERSNGEILWKLGGTRTEESLRVRGDLTPTTSLAASTTPASRAREG